MGVNKLSLISKDYLSNACTIFISYFFLP